MLELIVVACLIAQPAKCETFHLPFEEPMGGHQCVFRAQLRLVQWLERRPDWQIRRWTCGLPRA